MKYSNSLDVNSKERSQVDYFKSILFINPEYIGAQWCSSIDNEMNVQHRSIQVYTGRLCGE